MVEITDRDSAKAWLETQPHQVSTAMAARAALRGLAGLGKGDTSVLENLVVPVMRAVLTAGTVSTCPQDEAGDLQMTATSAAFVGFSANNNVVFHSVNLAIASVSSAAIAADVAARAADAAAHSADSIAFAAAESNFWSDVEVVDSASGDAMAADFSAAMSSAYSVFKKDADDVVAERNLNLLFRNRVWREVAEPEGVDEARAALLRFLDADPAKWDFWARWYRGMFDGQPMDWALQRAVALIPDDVWDAGPEAVAKRIAAIEAEFAANEVEPDVSEEAERLAEALPLAETIEFNAETGLFRRSVSPVVNPPLLAASLSQVSDALDDVLANPSNGLNAQSRETLVLRRMALKYANDPQRIEMDFVSVHAGLTRQIVTEDLPPSEANLALQSALEDGARGIRATHPDIAENRRILNAQALAELDPAQKQRVAEALPVLDAISEPELAEGWAEDIAEIVARQTRPVEITREFGATERNPVLASYAAEARVFSRAAQIGMLLRKTPELIHRIDGSAGYKGARIVATIAALISLGIVLIG